MIFESSVSNLKWASFGSRRKSDASFGELELLEGFYWDSDALVYTSIDSDC
jgi:hypothetical protein